MDEKGMDLNKIKQSSIERLNQLVQEYCGGNQQRFVERTKLNKGAVSQYINGKRAVSNLAASKIGKAFGISPAWVMGFDVPIKPNQYQWTYHKGELERRELCVLSLYEDLGWEEFHIMDAYEKFSQEGKNELFSFVEYLIMKEGIKEYLKTKAQMDENFEIINQSSKH